MFKERLSKCRQDKNMSQTAVAEKLSITRQAYNHYETGQRQPTQETLSQLADLFGVSVDYLLGRTDEPIPQSLDEQLDGIEFALLGEVKDLTDEEKQDILDFVKFTKSKRKDT